MSGYSRGGLWTNAEDEILKAAVAKYGLTQWSRCSSLLNRKTAKQCKARWNNWLSPNIKKAEWTTREDEKLLSMAKILPNQWQTIAPLVGRTPNQCIERYQKLLDDLEDSAAVSSSANPEAIAPTGPKINLSGVDDGMSNVPESKPARPDAIDMDDDEREMISEARARLANTQGKKAKRKQRERLLAQSRRVALLQKRRELKSAGFNVKSSLVSKSQKKAAQNFMDYNSDIPFERKPEVTVYDIAEEESKDLKDKERFQKAIASKAGLNDRASNRKRKSLANKNEGKIYIVRTEDVDESELLAKKRKLELPAPKFGTNEHKEQKLQDQLAQIAENEGLTVEKVKEKIQEDDSWLRTKLPESSEDRIKRLGNDLKIMLQSQSSLLDAKDIEQEMEKQPIAEPQRPTHKPKPLAEHSAKQVAKRLRKLFALLPPPKNDFEIGEIESSDEEEEVDNFVKNGKINDDLGEVKRKEKELSEAEKREKLLLRSIAIQKKLPLPYINSQTKTYKAISNFPLLSQYKIANHKVIQEQLDKEMLQLIVSDYLKSEYLGDVEDLLHDKQLKNDIVDDLDKLSRYQAISLIASELEKVKKENVQYYATLGSTLERVIKGKSYAFPGFDGELDSKQADQLAEKMIVSIKNISKQANNLERQLV